MQRRFNSFLLRFWARADGTIRIEIEHIQEGARVVVDSTAVALSWIDHHAAADRVRVALESASGLRGRGPADENAADPAEDEPTTDDKLPP